MLEQDCNAFGSQSLNFQEFQCGGRVFEQQDVAALTGSALDNLGQHSGQSLADTRDVGDLPFRIFHDIGDAFRIALDGGGPIAIAPDAERILAGDFHEVGGFIAGLLLVHLFVRSPAASVP